MEITESYYPKNRQQWRKWLLKNHAKKKEIWIIYDRKHKNEKRVTYADALDEALCFGWIDGQVKGVNKDQYAQRFTPRRAKSAWSTLNMKHYARLSKAGLVHESGKRAYQTKDRIYDPKAESPLHAIRADFKKLAKPQKAKAMMGFKTGKGEYAEGDVFLGLTVPEVRSIAKKYSGMALSRTEYLLQKGKHEERLGALFILVDRFRKSDGKEQKRIFDIYLKNTKHINNWDLVDASAHYIAGAYLHGKPKTALYTLARSKNLWEKRIAMVATFYDIQKGDAKEAHKIADMLLSDSHDLIHKAVGWMLREAGKRVSRDDLKKYLKSRVGKIPRTALRYAIEHFPEQERKVFLAMK